MHPGAQGPAEPHQLLPALPDCHPGKGCGVLSCPGCKALCPEVPSQGRRGARGMAGCVGTRVVAQGRQAPARLPLQSGSRQARGAQGVLGAHHYPPLGGRAGWRGAACAVCTGAASRPPGPRGVLQGTCRLAFGSRRFPQVQRGSAEDLSLFSFNMKEGHARRCAARRFR